MCACVIIQQTLDWNGCHTYRGCSQYPSDSKKQAIVDKCSFSLWHDAKRCSHFPQRLSGAIRESADNPCQALAPANRCHHCQARLWH
ncbi:hypothetical protein GOODEAATRI_002819 [Goodea atripinnis]|uniref:Uncharacterized protein n=1 Tax=Goodea atripinnis TaxID=208336 RepID=A0ABV0N8F2_9TELE